MASNENNTSEVKEFIQTVSINSAKEDDTIIDEENETQEESSPQETIDEEETEETTEEKSEDTEESTESTVDETTNTDTEIKPVEGETPRERALRLETTRLRNLLRQERKDELLPVKKQDESQLKIDDELAQYDPEELKRFDTLARKMGFVKNEELEQRTSKEQMDGVLEDFLQEHPEYAPENDTDGVMWNQLKSEFSLYNAPKDPKTLRKVLAKAHNDIVGIQPAAKLTKINASREKIKVASHAGAATTKESKAPVRKSQPSGHRTDMMKGFSDEDLKDIFG